MLTGRISPCVAMNSPFFVRQEPGDGVEIGGKHHQNLAQQREKNESIQDRRLLRAGGFPPALCCRYFRSFVGKKTQQQGKCFIATPVCEIVWLSIVAREGKNML
jgi:hypothetical protein